jgi:tRNA uridine 5-carboxymethylaminomethyl modification enzyme
LTEKGRDLHLVDDDRWRSFVEKRDAIESERQRLNGIWISPGSEFALSLEKLHGIVLNKESRALELLRRPEMDYGKLVSVEGLGPGVSDQRVSEQLEIQIRYSGYLGRQKEDIERMQRQEGQHIGDDFDYSRVKGLSSELREKLECARPDTVGQASRIPGMTPVAVSLLLVHLKKNRKQVA